MTVSPNNSSPVASKISLIKKWFEEHRLWLALTIVALLIVIVGVLGGWQGTVVFIIPVLIALLTALPDSIRKHLRFDEFFFPASLIVLLLLILAIVALWLSVRLFWTVEESRRTVTTGSVASVRRAALEFSVPTKVLANDQPVTLTLTSLMSLLPLEVAVELPPELRFYPSSRNGRELFVTLSPGEVVALPIVNSRQNSFSSLQPISVTVCGDKYDPFLIVVEGEWAGALRRLLDRVEAQPSLLLTLLGGGLLAQLFQWVQYHYQREQRQKEEVGEAEEKIKNSLERGGMEEVGKELAAWEKLKPAGDEPAAVLAARRLLRVAQAEVESGDELLKTVESCAGRWPDSCARALQTGYESLAARMDPATLRRARSYLQPKNRELIHWEEDLKRREDKRRDIAPGWLSPTLEPPAAAQRGAARTGSLSDLRHHWQAAAEDDRWHLFHRSPNAFWPDHPLSHQLRETRDSRLVYSASGSGGTALALSLALYPLPRTKPFLGLYSTGSADLREIQKGFAKHLLLFIEKYRSEVNALNAEELKLLAHCLGTYLGWDLVASEVERIRKDESDLKEFDELGRDFWSRRIGAAFDHLQKTLEQARAMPSKPTWPYDLCVCARSLQLKRVLLVVDIHDHDPPRLRNELLPQVHCWAGDGLITLVFISGAEKDSSGVARGVPAVTLKWDAEQLQSILKHRYRTAFPGQPFPLDDSRLAQLAQECVNSRGTPWELRELCISSNAP